MNRKQHSPVSQASLSIRRAVKEHPGIHFRGLGRAARVSSAGQLRHHLDRLEHQGLVIEVEDGRYKRFFVAGDHDPKMRTEMARFSRAVPRRIAKLLLVSPMNRTELRRSLGCADSTLGYHLTRMVVLGDLARTRGPNSCLYSLTSGDTVRKMLVLQGASEAPAACGDATSTTTVSTTATTIAPELGTDNGIENATAPARDENVPNPLRPRGLPTPNLPFPGQSSDAAQPSDDAAPTA